jgi:hypothetical protein
MSASRDEAFWPLRQSAHVQPVFRLDDFNTYCAVKSQPDAHLKSGSILVSSFLAPCATGIWAPGASLFYETDYLSLATDYRRTVFLSSATRTPRLKGFLRTPIHLGPLPY